MSDKLIIFVEQYKPYPTFYINHIFILIVVLPCILISSHAAQHPLHTLETEAHIATAQQQF
jgi:hypothetical protein